MLKFMRRNASGRWVQVIFTLIILIFIFWGVGYGISGNPEQVVATVNGDKILVVDYERAYRNMERAYRDIFKDHFDDNLVKSLNLRGRTVEQLIRAKLLRQEAEKLGLLVTDEELRTSIASEAAFQRDGRFDRDLYIRVLASPGNKFAPSEFEELQREEMLVGKLQDLILGGVQVTDTEARQHFDFDNEKVVLRYLALTADNFLDQVQVSDADVQAYYDAHKDEFTEPDRVRVEYAFYGFESFNEGSQPSAQEVEDYYKANTADFEQPEQVHARHILFRLAPDASAEDKEKVKQKAAAVLAQAKGGADFAELAKQNSEDSSASQGGDLGLFPRGRMVPAFEQAAFALEPGQVSELVETNFGIHIIKVETKQAAGPEPLDQVRPRISSQLQRERASAKANEKAQAAQARVTGGEALATVAKADGIDSKTSSPVGAGETIPGFDHSGPVVDAALKIDVNQVGALLATSDGFVVFRVVEKIPSHVAELAQITDKVRDAARRAKATEIAKEKAKELFEQLKSSRNIEAVATAGNGKVEETAPFARAGAFIPGLGAAPDLTKDAFKLTTEAPVAPQVYAIGNKQVLAVLKERVPADEAEFTQKKDGLVTQITGQRRTDTINSFVGELRKKAKIEMGPSFTDIAVVG